MGLSKVNVWISSTGNPCEITNEQFYVQVLNCHGKILEWCKVNYTSIPTKCGHVEIQLPPGCYIIRAAKWISTADPYKGNTVTHYGLLSVGCENTYCVTLYYPGVHVCWASLGFALNAMVHEKVLTPDVIKAMDVIKVQIDKLPMTAFDKENIRGLEVLNKTLLEQRKA